MNYKKWSKLQICPQPEFRKLMIYVIVYQKSPQALDIIVKLIYLLLCIELFQFQNSVMFGIFSYNFSIHNRYNLLLKLTLRKYTH